ncbi:MAG: CTP synthase [Thaumarchaeota archaeon]|nr:CTP synthase [Nitrososphaerota archaeon]
MPKYIFVIGGVMSGLGKGVTSASIAKLLQLTGLKVACAKVDPYLNVDAGTMNPIIHGEVFVTDDGGETDMDLGTYERFLEENLSRSHNITTGQVYKAVIESERRGDYLGRCVQIIPHVTDEIKNRIRGVARDSGGDVLLVEVGGTVGDIEGLPFLEALRQMRLEEGASNTVFVHVTLAPVLDSVGEQKTKPTQHSVQELRRIGIQPDLIVARCEKPLAPETKEKISLFTSVENRCVISNPDVEAIYQVPQILFEEGIVEPLCEKLQLGNRKVNWGNWRETTDAYTNRTGVVKIAMVGKYVALPDSYVSVNHALAHAGAKNGFKVEVDWVDAERFEKKPDSVNILDSYDGVLVPGGFGNRGSLGKIMTANHARINKIPYLGICFGFQMAIVSFARYVCGLKDANSTELDERTSNPVIDLLPEQKNVTDKGASMRLGGHDIAIVEGTLARRLYGSATIRERHRHRYEFNQDYRSLLEQHGIVFSGYSDSGRRTEMLEIPSLPFYFATQFHPEYVSRPTSPEPAYLGFVRAAIERRMSKNFPPDTGSSTLTVPRSKL